MLNRLLLHSPRRLCLRNGTSAGCLARCVDIACTSLPPSLVLISVVSRRKFFTSSALRLKSSPDAPKPAASRKGKKKKTGGKNVAAKTTGTVGSAPSPSPARAPAPSPAPLPPTPSLLPPSAEQQVAIDTLLHTPNNIIVDACAGSGKTTTILHLARAAPATKFLVLVYNRRLMDETTIRVNGLGLTNITVLNYHALGARCYTAECSTDQGMKRVVEKDMAVRDDAPLPDFEVLVMDEQQDMTPILKRFVDKVIRDKGFATAAGGPKQQKGPTLRLVLLGDQRQEVYSFNNADSRFLTLADRPELFGYVNDSPWTAAAQTTSNRATQPLVDFFNAQMLKSPLGAEMRAVRAVDRLGKPYPKPRYVVCNPELDLMAEIRRLLALPGVTETDIIVLTPSVRGRSSAAILLANDLALARIPVYRSDSDVADVGPEVAAGKILICTYHQAKGIERKAAVVLGFDQGYHLYYDKVAEPPRAVRNPQYVAATRALEHLVLVHDCKNEPLPFVDIDTVGLTSDLVLVRPLGSGAGATRKKSPFPAYKVTNLCRNLSETLITKCLGHIDVTLLAVPTYGVEPPPKKNIPDRDGLVEPVSAITGTAVPAIFQWRQRKRTVIFDGLRKLLKPPARPLKTRHPLRELPQPYYDRLQLAVDRYDDGNGVLAIDDLLYAANLTMGGIDGDITRVIAIPFEGYNWLSEGHCRDVRFVLGSLPPPASISGRGIFFEHKRHRKFPAITHGGGPTNPVQRNTVIVSGAMDICRLSRQSRTVWEVKYTESLQPEHLLQLALYMLLLDGGPKPAESEHENNSDKSADNTNANDANTDNTDGEDTPPAPAAGFLVSARTGHTVQVRPRAADSLHEILQLLVNNASGGPKTRLLNTYSDEEFLAEAGADFAGLVGRCALPEWFAMRQQGSRYVGGGKKGGRRRKSLEGGVLVPVMERGEEVAAAA